MQLRAGNPCELKGCLRWPSSKEMLPGLDCSMIQQLQPLFDSCVSKDAPAISSFEQIQHELAGVLAEARAALAIKAAAGATVYVQADGGAAACYSSLGPGSQEFSLPLAPMAAAAMQKSDAMQNSSPFAAAGGPQCVLTSSCAAGDTPLNATAAS